MMRPIALATDPALRIADDEAARQVNGQDTMTITAAQIAYSRKSKDQAIHTLKQRSEDPACAGPSRALLQTMQFAKWASFLKARSTAENGI